MQLINKENRELSFFAMAHGFFRLHLVSSGVREYVVTYSKRTGPMCCRSETDSGRLDASVLTLLQWLLNDFYRVASFQDVVLLPLCLLQCSNLSGLPRQYFSFQPLET